MPRTVEIALPSGKTEDLISKVEKLDGLIGMRLQKNSSLKPKGDILTLEITNRSIEELMRLLDNNNMLDDTYVSVTTSQPLSVISKASSKKINTDHGETTWEEMLANINKESNMSINNMFIMFLAGVIAVIGITANALHIVVGAMVIAPGFEPVARISLGLVTRHSDWRQGLKDTLKDYIALLVGAIVTAFIMQMMGKDIIGGEPSYLPKGVLISHWTSIKTTSILITIAAAAAGALVIITNRHLLTAGVMIALTLVPAASITGMGIVAGDFDVQEKRSCAY